MKEKYDKLSKFIELLKIITDEKELNTTRITAVFEELKQNKLIKEYCIDDELNFCITRYHKKEIDVEEKFIKLYIKEYITGKDRKSFIDGWRLYEML